MLVKGMLGEQRSLKNSDLRNRLLKVGQIIQRIRPELRSNFYIDFARRYEVVLLVRDFCKKGSKILDAGAQPFILSAMLKELGYDVYAVDIEPENYIDIAKIFDIKVGKVDLERDKLDFPDSYFDCVVFSEVLEHLNPYYVDHALSEINRVLRSEGILILTTPNIASLFRRIKMLLGKQPIYRYHVREYTKREVEELLTSHGFKILRSYYSLAYDRALLMPKNDSSLELLANIRSYIDMLKFFLKNPNLRNLARILAYPIVRVVPTLRTTIVIIAQKMEEAHVEEKIIRWG